VTVYIVAKDFQTALSTPDGHGPTDPARASAWHRPPVIVNSTLMNVAVSLHRHSTVRQRVQTRQRFPALSDSRGLSPTGVSVACSSLNYLKIRSNIFNR
jgi:hypothetical protein